MREPIWRPFLHSAGSAAAGFAALVSASWVDALVLGRVLGGEAVAAVGVLVPALTLVLGAALVAGIGGSVAANRCRAAGDGTGAGRLFGGSLGLALAVGTALALTGWCWQDAISTTLAPAGSIRDRLQEYLRVLVWGFPLQSAAVVLYYFARLTAPAKAMAGLWAGALLNIVLDLWWVAGLDWGMAGAAAATVMAQVAQIVYLARALRADSTAPRPALPRGRLDAGEFGRAMAGGLADGVSEWSGGLVLLAVYAQLQVVAGPPAVTAFALLNLACLVYWFAAASAGEAVHALASYDVGRGRGVQAARRCGLITAGALGLLQIGFWSVCGPRIWSWQLQGETAPLELLPALWPPIAALFALAGFNIAAIAAATAAGAIRLALPLALLRALILPLGLIHVLGWWDAGTQVLWALPLAEALVLVLLLGLVYQGRSMTAPQPA